MQLLEGNLLIGGMRLSQLEGQLDLEQPDEESCDWVFSGSFLLSSENCRLLQIGRTYRLELPDGRAGQVVISQLRPDPNDERFVAQFHPHRRTPHQPR